MKKIYLLSIIFCFAIQTEPQIIAVEDLSDGDLEYVYIPKHIQEEIASLEEIVPLWAKQYYDFYTNENEHIACRYNDVHNMLEKLLMEIPQEYPKRSIISDFYDSITRPVAIDVNNSISELKDITAQGNLNLPNSTNSVGVITKNNLPFISNPGGRNTFVGINAGSLNLTGTGNVALGTIGESPYGAPLQAITNAQSNVAIGNGTLSSLQLGLTNIAIGNEALTTSTIAIGNIAIGAAALLKVNDPATVVGNIVIGSGAGADLVTGNNNIYIGTMTGSGITNESGHIRIGGQVKQTACTIQGITGSTAVSGVPVLINSNGDLGTVTSSERYKKDIQDMDDISNDISLLRPVTFIYKEAIDPVGITQYGLIAEEVAKVYPDLVLYNEKNEPEAVKYHLLNILLLNEMQKLMKECKHLKEENKKLVGTLVDIRKRIEKLEKK